MTIRFDKSKLPSRHVSVGPERAPHRSYYYAMGLTEEEIARPFVGIASAGNDSAPCNTTLDAQADVCREGVNEAGGMPRRFNTITVTDGRHRRISCGRMSSYIPLRGHRFPECFRRRVARSRLGHKRIQQGTACHPRRRGEHTTC